MSINRIEYFNYIEEKLSILSTRINNRGKLNILDANLHSENFYMELLNLLYDFKLENLNTSNQNVEGIDLIDYKNKLIIQVSSTTTKQKIESSLSKDIFKSYNEYKFVFVSIANNADNLRRNNFKNPNKVSFNPKNDIYDIPRILKDVFALSIDKQKQIYEFIRKELGDSLDIVKLDSDLANIINILSKENLSNIKQSINIDSFQIDKKIEYNKLNLASFIIEDYKIYNGHVEKKYIEFDKLGVNKSFAVLQTIRGKYIELCTNGKCQNADILFLEIIKKVKELILASKNCIDLSFEMLELCVNILVVDAFIRCKIFKNPEGYNYVITR
ncbi:ABC-three component system protein [Clostridium nigeriense]|uniref:ABC-three component system protein n=1 Tax=Clostridium nigeriense TaxID=1805470 RepID=UPI000B1D76C4|nr:ABC-three component system protein [Clostridium nigeriense]